MRVSTTSAKSPVRSSQAGWWPPNQESTLEAAIRAKSGRRSMDSRYPPSPMADSRLMVSAPEPTPASRTRAPGKMSPMATTWPESLG